MTSLPASGAAMAIARAVLESPRFAHATTVAAIGVAVGSQFLVRLIGWAGLVGMLTALVVLMAGMAFVRRSEIRWLSLLPVSLLVFVGWTCLSILWSPYRSATAGGLAYLLAFTALGIGIALVRDTIQIVRAFGDVFRAVLVVSIALEIFAGLLIDSPIPFLEVQGDLDTLGPIQGIMGSRNQLGLLALLAVITFGTEFRTRSVSRGVGIGSLVLGIAGVLLSRSPVISAVFLVVALAVVALYLLRRLTPERRTIWQLALLAAAAVLAIAAWIVRAPLIALFSANSELSYRLTLWRGILNLITQNPLEGWGWVGYWRPDIMPFPIFAISGEREPTSAVNAYLDVWFQLGFVGLVIFLGLVLLTFTRSWLLAGRRRSTVFAWPALMLVALLVTSLTESSLLVEYGWLLFVVCTVKAAQELSWRGAFANSDVPD
ncbi:MAG: exopolysaccharide biosynthesis protein [Rhodoglobus sp.]|nr:exopolysaccharide biosynthesis protein [Rhodoglobus sp.]